MLTGERGGRTGCDGVEGGRRARRAGRARGEKPGTREDLQEGEGRLSAGVSPCHLLRQLHFCEVGGGRRWEPRGGRQERREEAKRPVKTQSRRRRVYVQESATRGLPLALPRSQQVSLPATPSPSFPLTSSASPSASTFLALSLPSPTHRSTAASPAPSAPHRAAGRPRKPPPCSTPCGRRVLRGWGSQGSSGPLGVCSSDGLLRPSLHRLKATQSAPRGSGREGPHCLEGGGGCEMILPSLPPSPRAPSFLSLPNPMSPLPLPLPTC